VLVGGIIVEDHRDRLVGRHLALDGIAKADEFLMAVALPAAADELAFATIEGGEQSLPRGPLAHGPRIKSGAGFDPWGRPGGGGSVALVVVGQGGAAPFLHGPPRLGAIEGLDLAVRVDAEHHGRGRRIDREADHILALLSQVGIVGELAMAHPMRLAAVTLPDAAPKTG